VIPRQVLVDALGNFVALRNGLDHRRRPEHRIPRREDTGARGREVALHLDSRIAVEGHAGLAHAGSIRALPDRLDDYIHRQHELGALDRVRAAPGALVEIAELLADQLQPLNLAVPDDSGRVH